jgi:Fe-S-cluster containining protein
MTSRRVERDDPSAPEESSPSPPPFQPEDVANGLRFVHLVEMQTKARLSELTASVNAMLEVLIGEGHLPLEAYEKRRRLTVVRENERSGEEATVQLSDVPDKYALRDLPQIDCASRLHLCKARCCMLSFALSVQDLDERVVRWNYGLPYRIARRPDGYCVHNDGGCTVYEHRPAVCRTYDCRQDRRIWIDFDKGIPAP